jgi:uncharacterized protein YprB with RNaseH-like and TPR domain
MISDYEYLVSGARFHGDEVCNSFGKCSVIVNSLPEVDDIAYEDYFGINFLDIETTGLSGIDQPLFLIGLLSVRQDGLSCTQLLARAPSEEPAILFELLRHIKHRSAVMTFNGESFDIPYIEKRMSYCSLNLPEIVSVDLLKPARKRYKDKLASCSLQSLERNILNLSDWNREDDIPGSQIPRVYWDYVNNGNYNLLLPIIRHNIMDLISTARLWGIFMRP